VSVKKGKNMKAAIDYFYFGFGSSRVRIIVEFGLITEEKLAMKILRNACARFLKNARKMGETGRVLAIGDRFFIKEAIVETYSK
jgi:hypothetical protein